MKTKTTIKCPKCNNILEVFISKTWQIFRCPECQCNFVID